MIFLLVFVAAGCGSKKESAEAAAPAVKEITYANAADISTLDPRNATGTDTAAILAHMFSSLLKTDKDMQVVPDLAASYENIDSTTWKFTLKDNVTFHDGSKLTSADVKYTFDTIADKDKKYRLASDFSFISIEVIDDYSFFLKTAEPFADLQIRLNYVKILPKAYLEEVGDEEFAKNPIGSGPFKYVERLKDERVVIEAYDGYFGGKPALDKITYKIIPEAASRIAALEAGEVDIIGKVSTSQVPRLQSLDNIEVVGNPTTRVIFLGMNSIAEGPLQDVRVRKALNYAVDRDLIIEGVLDGYGNKLASISNPEFFGYDASIAGFEYNPEKAKALLAEAGYADGLDLDFSVTTSYLNGTDVAQAIAAQLAEVGVNVNLQQIDAGQQREQIINKTISGLYMFGIGGPYCTIDLVAKLSFSTGERYSTYSNPEFDALRKKAAATIDDAERAALLSDLQQMAIDNAAGLFLYQQYGLLAQNSRVQNWSPRIDEMIVLIDADVK